MGGLEYLDEKRCQRESGVGGLDLEQYRLIKICWACIGRCLFDPAGHESDHKTVPTLEELV